MAVRFGTFVPQGWRQDLTEIANPVEQYATLTRCAQEAEAAGFDSVWVFDHFHTVPSAELKSTFEAWTVMAGLARDTHRVRLGQMVTCNEYRPPALLAKMASCIDVMSNGRLIVGMGAGWYEQEFDAYGYEFGEMPERLRRLRESLQVLKALWTRERADFDGRYYRLRGAVNEPKPVQKPHPPLWVGGGGEQVTLRLVARHGDACNFAGDTETLRRKLEILKRHCDEAGRDYDTITRSTNFTCYVGDEREVERQLEKTARFTGGEARLLREQAGRTAGPPEQVAEAIRERVALGFDYVIVFLPQTAEGGHIRRFAEEVIPLVG